MSTLFRHFLLTASVVFLLGHSMVAHAHQGELGGIHSPDLIHRLADLFSTDLGEGHLEHLDEPQTGSSEVGLPALQPALLPVLFLLIPAFSEPEIFTPVTSSGAVLPSSGYGSAWDLRGPPARK